MTADEWFAVGAIVVTLLVAAGAWASQHRHTERDAVLQDLQIRDLLAPGKARRLLEDSIDERVARLAQRAERQRNDDLLEVAGPLFFGGLLMTTLGGIGTTAWMIQAGIVVAAAGVLSAFLGWPKAKPYERKRLTRRRPVTRDAAEPRPRTAPPDPAKAPGPPGWRRWLRRPVRSVTRAPERGAPTRHP
jgi:hypothetical protein